MHNSFEESHGVWNSCLRNLYNINQDKPLTKVYQLNNTILEHVDYATYIVTLLHKLLHYFWSHGIVIPRRTDTLWRRPRIIRWVCAVGQRERGSISELWKELKWLSHWCIRCWLGWWLLQQMIWVCSMVISVLDAPIFTNSIRQLVGQTTANLLLPSIQFPIGISYLRNWCRPAHVTSSMGGLLHN